MEVARITAIRSRHMEERLTIFLVGRHPDGESVAQRKVHGTAESHILVVAILRLHPAAEVIESWIGLIDEKGPAGGVLAGEGALRAAQHFNTVNVVVGLIGDESVGRRCHAVAIDQNAGRILLSCVALADSTDVDHRVLAGALDGEGRCREGKIIDGVNLPRSKVHARQYRGRNRRYLKIDRALLGRYDDFLQFVRRGRLT